MNELLINSLKKARFDRGLKQQDVADQLGIKANTISNWEKGRTEPDIDSFVKLCNIYHVDCASLLSEAYAFKRIGTDISPSEYDHIKKYRTLDTAGRSHIDSMLDWEVERSGQLRLSRKQSLNRLLSYYGRIAAAGKNYGFEDVICGTIEVPLTDENQNADFTIGVSGNSMEPDFTGDDIVYVQKVHHLNRDDIGIFQKDHCIYIKKVGDGELTSINPEYAPIPGEDMNILGKVIGKIEGDYRIIK